MKDCKRILIKLIDTNNSSPLRERSSLREQQKHCCHPIKVKDEIKLSDYLYTCITVLTVFIFVCIVLRISITIWENCNLVNKFTANPDEPYQQRIPIKEKDFIDDYVYRLYAPFAVDLMGRPNTFVLKQPISYYSAPDDNLEPVITLEAGKKYIINTYDINSYKYGIQSWPTYNKGWRFVIPFVEAGNEKSVTQAYYVKLKDLFSPLKTIKKVVHYQIPKGYNNRRLLLIKDEMLYKEGCYLSPDLLKPVLDDWNIILLVIGFYLIAIKIISRAEHCTKQKIIKQTKSRRI